MVVLNCETWRLCDCVTPNVVAVVQPSRTTFATSGRFRVVVSSRNGAITHIFGRAFHKCELVDSGVQQNVWSGGEIVQY